MKKGWSISTNIMWDLDHNVPAFREDCWDCNLKELPMTLPGDARFAFDHDLQLLEEVLRRQYNRRGLAEKVLGGKGIVLVNKGSGLDDFREIFSRGTIVGKLFWEPVEREWKFRPAYAAAKVLVEEGAADTVNVEDHPKEGTSILSAGCEERSEVILVRGGEPVGVGLCRRGRIRVITSFPPEVVGKDPFPAKDIPTTIEDTIKFNEKRIIRMISQSKRFLFSMINKVDKPLTVSFSGGKDSLVALHLTLDMKKPIVIFNDTGIEMPETIKTVEKVVNKLSLELVVADAGDGFWRAVRKVSPPARDLRWCCKVTKLVPMARLVKEKWPEGTLNVVGQRAFESLERSKSPRVWRNKWFPQVLNITPIQYWTQLDVWMYIFYKNIVDLVNPLYFKGFERVGCFMCPASLLAEFEFTKKVHPELWKKWEDELERWRNIIGLPPEWSEYGLWRWLAPNSRKKTFMNKLKVWYDWKKEYSGRLLPRVEIERDNKHVKLKYNVSITHAIEDQKSILFGKSKDKSVEGQIVRISEREVVIEGDGAEEEALVVDALIRRWYQCMECKSCELWCPTGAIKVERRPRVDPEKCVSCRLCVLQCPIYEPIVDRITSSLMLGKPDGWRRKTKKKRKELIKELKEAVMEGVEGLGGPTTA